MIRHADLTLASIYIYINIHICIHENSTCIDGCKWGFSYDLSVENEEKMVCHHPKQGGNQWIMKHSKCLLGYHVHILRDMPNVSNNGMVETGKLKPQITGWWLYSNHLEKY